MMFASARIQSAPSEIAILALALRAIEQSACAKTARSERRFATVRRAPLSLHLGSPGGALAKACLLHSRQTRTSLLRKE
jgi:hypothetical protein